MLQVPGVDISSTELRRRAAAGETLRYLTPWPVVQYIEANQLYVERPRKITSVAGGAAGRKATRHSVLAEE